MVAGVKPTHDPSRAPSPGRPLDIPEADWSEAVRREATVRALAAADVNSRSAVHAAAASLGLSPPGLSIDRAVPSASGHFVARRNQTWSEEGRPACCPAKSSFGSRRPSIPSSSNANAPPLRSCGATPQGLRRAGSKPRHEGGPGWRNGPSAAQESVKARDGTKGWARRNPLPPVSGLRPSSAVGDRRIDQHQVDIELVDDLARAVEGVLGRPSAPDVFLSSSAFIVLL